MQCATCTHGILEAYLAAECDSCGLFQIHLDCALLHGERVIESGRRTDAATDASVQRALLASRLRQFYVSQRVCCPRCLQGTIQAAQLLRTAEQTQPPPAELCGTWIELGTCSALDCSRCHSLQELRDRERHAAAAPPNPEAPAEDLPAMLSLLGVHS